ncbi:MAG: RHS repeat-associated core domain-containing protein [Pirellula sp.]
MTSETTTIPQVTSALGASSVTSTMIYTFDTVGRMTSKSLSNGSTVQYTDAMTYDFRNRMTQQSRTQSSGGSLWSKFTYNTLDLVTTAEQGTGSVTSNPELVQTTTRDLAGRPTSISYQSGTNALATYSMAYVSASNRLASLTTPQGTTNYGYSANGQLIQAGSTGYTYDANGNPTNRAGKTTQIGTWNRLLDDGDFTYQYDAEGRTTGRTSKTTGQTESYVWNRRGQLTQIDVHSNAARTNRTGQVNYSYDPTGRRTSVRNQTGIGSSSYAQSVDYLMSDGDQVGQILGATGQTTRRFRYGIGVDSVLSEQRFSGGTASNPEYQLTDHLGTVRGVAQRTTGVNAVVVNTLQYDSFGKLISQSNASKQPYHGFAGRDIEPVGGLTYNRNRYYSTQTGRFISQDPIGFNAGDENLYRYVGNSPTNARDPSGLWQSGDGKPSQMEVEIEYQLQKVAKSREILVGSVPPNNFVQRMLIGTAYDVAVGVGALSVGSIYNELYDPGNDYETALGLSYVSKTSLVPDGGFTPAEIALNTARRQIAEIAKEADGIGAAVGVTATPLIDELVVEGATTIIPVPVVATIGKRVLTVADDAGKIVLKLSDDLLKSGSHAGLAPKSTDLMNELGQLGGELFPAERIPALVKYLERRGIYLHEGINGSFDGVRGVMTLPRNPTKLNVRHELSHMLDYFRYRDDYYVLFTRSEREQMVLERLKNNRIWDKLNDAERDWSVNYPCKLP